MLLLLVIFISSIFLTIISMIFWGFCKKKKIKITEVEILTLLIGISIIYSFIFAIVFVIVDGGIIKASFAAVSFVWGVLFFILYKLKEEKENNETVLNNRNNIKKKYLWNEEKQEFEEKE